MSQIQGIEKQHSKGKLHASERLGLLFDEPVYRELAPAEQADGVIVCTGRVGGCQVVVAAQDFTVRGGSLGHRQAEAIVRAQKYALKKKLPFLFINDSGGARIQEGIRSLAGYGDIFYMNTRMSGVVPQISVIAGPCAGGAVYSPGLTDFIFMVDKIGEMFITGPAVLREVTGETVTPQQLGGCDMHTSASGVAHVRCAGEAECYEKLRELIPLICAKQKAGGTDIPAKMPSIHIPDDKRRGYDVRAVIAEVFDSPLFELQAEFARSVVIGFSTLAGATVGIIANQPSCFAGSLDVDSSDKAARFVRFCDCFDIPIVTFTDVPGYMPGVGQEQRGIIRHGAKLLYAFSEARVPRANVIMRKAFGGAYIAMNSKHLGAGYVVAWKGSEIAVMGAEGAVSILYKKQAAALAGEEKRQFLKAKIEEYERDVMNCAEALNRGYIDKIIDPNDTRAELIAFFASHKRKPFRRRRHHGNIPL